MADPREVLIDCLRLVLKPVVRFCLKRSLKLQDFTEAAKQVYLETATEALEAEGEQRNVSKLSVMTGLHRRDVDRIVHETGPLRYGNDLLSRVIGQWQSDKRYSTRGRARLLSFEGKESEFAELVASVSKNLNPYTVLFELERVGAVERGAGGLKLIRRTYEASSDLREGFSLLSGDCGDLISAVEENLTCRPSVPNLHSKTQYDNICTDHLDTIRSWILERGRVFHEEAREFLAQFDKDINPKLKNRPGGGRAAIGTFSFVEGSGEPDQKLAENSSKGKR